MTELRENSKNTSRIIGALSGVLLSVLWVCLVFSIESWNNTQHTQMNFHNPLIAWIYLGPLPLFIAAGYFYLNRLSGFDLKKPQQLATMKGLIVGFFVWIAVIISVPDSGNGSFFFPNRWRFSADACPQ
jgi:uncharacterized membrane-anchored protein